MALTHYLTEWILSTSQWYNVGIYSVLKVVAFIHCGFYLTVIRAAGGVYDFWNFEQV